MSETLVRPHDRAARFDAIVVGAGFAGMYMLHRLRVSGFTARVLEAGGDVGGTWYWNRYPGARCDVESLEYSYSFCPEITREWSWSERYAAQPEILRYAGYVADRLNLREDIRFGTRVTGAVYDEDDGCWTVTTEHGAPLRARFLITAVGCLSAANVPDLPGLGSFEGRWYHTGRWPHEGVDFTGERVAVVGTGSSGIQLIPAVAEQAAHVTVFQRTPNFSTPAVNGPLDPARERWFKDNRDALARRARTSPGGFLIEYGERSALEVSPEERLAEFERRWSRGGVGFLAAFSDLLLSEEANRTAADFVRDKIRSIVTDRATAERLVPTGYSIGLKRLCLDTGYYAVYNRPDVTLVDLRETPITEIVPNGIRTAGETFDVDAVVFATGYDAITGALLAMDIRGRGGRRLRDAWAAGPSSYLGLMSAGFPNLFTITGPGSPSVLTNMIVSIEQHVEWIAACLADLERAFGPRALIEAEAGAEAAWMDHVRELAEFTLYGRAESWYSGANIAGKPRTFLPYAGGVGNYRAMCDRVAARGYEGFLRTALPEGA
ncbi:NAD(P)/FAD-dependent oxidoreductase [Microbispora sp. NBRC 16548]|uniref:flavin-containing monooxygenase n=1 Tax=Microbispora sp. NBRC 16548 TaxID=3030994 RepID=UPI00180804F8|nr:NAD(P)/FAD-dependent oxidoreductase [Microbispora sp. NBRC 16548]GLX10019.1 cyclohexanone monooxygenase [Microbispora sp. NBRC 16548]